MYDISLIIPTYNVAEYLPRCLLSLDEQSFKNFEVILINDGSSDNSLDIITDYCKDKTNCTVISQRNQGVSAARNVGMEKASGKYLMFLDPDDSLPKDSLSNAFKAVSSDKYDFVIFKGYDMARKKAKYYRSSICFAIWDFSFLKKFNLTFDTRLESYEDRLLRNQAKYLSKHNTISEIAMYNRHLRPDSVTTSRDERLLQHHIFISELEKFLKENNLYEKNRADFLFTKSDCYWRIFTRVKPSLKKRAIEFIKSDFLPEEITYITENKVYRRAESLAKIFNANSFLGKVYLNLLIFKWSVKFKYNRFRRKL